MAGCPMPGQCERQRSGGDKDSHRKNHASHAVAPTRIPSTDLVLAGRSAGPSTAMAESWSAKGSAADSGSTNGADSRRLAPGYSDSANGSNSANGSKSTAGSGSAKSPGCTTSSGSSSTTSSGSAESSG